jgi:hypothetical protein
MLGYSGVATKQAASQEGLGSLELVILKTEAEYSSETLVTFYHAVS